MKSLSVSDIPLYLILLLAAFLLFFNLGARDYWSDEIFSLPKDIEDKNIRIVLEQSIRDVHPPLYFFITYYWTELVGRGEAAVRSLSAIFALATIVFAYLLAVRILPGKAPRLYLLLLATSPFFIFYSRMNRYYALTTLLSVAMVYFFLRMLKDRRIKWEVAFWGTSLLLIYEDYVGFILLASLGLYYLWHNRKEMRRWPRFFLGAALLFICYLPWINNLLSQAGKGSAPYPEHQPGEREFRALGFLIFKLKETLIRVIYTAYNFTLGETVFPWNPLFAAGVAGSGILFFFSLKDGESGGGFWFFVLVLPFIVYMGAVIFYSRVFSAANFALIPSKIMFLQPLWLMFLLRGGGRKRGWITAGILLLLAFNTAALTNYHRGRQYLNPKFIVPWRAITGELAGRCQANDLVVSDESPLNHYLKGTGVEGYGLVGAVEYISDRETPFTVYLVLRHRGEQSIYLEGRKLRDYFDQHYRRIGRWGYIAPTAQEARLRKLLLEEDIEHYVEVYAFLIDKDDSGD